MHPLQRKYGGSDPAAWDDAKRAAAREEFQKAIADDRAGVPGGKLSLADRTALIRIWIDIRGAQSAAEEAAAAAAAAAEARAASGEALPEPVPAPRPPAPRLARHQDHKHKHPPLFGPRQIWSFIRSLTLPDVVFLCALCGVTVAIVLLGKHSIGEVRRIEDVKTEAENVVVWLKDTAEKRSAEDFEPAACRKQDGATWSKCAAALVEAAGPLHEKFNPFVEGRPLLQRKCDAADWKNIGSIIIEKGVLQASGSYTYSSFDGTEPMAKDLTVRVVVCGRGFHLVKVVAELSL